jgi:L-seryl-tRNA(Ser) seleniumtransferase
VINAYATLTRLGGSLMPASVVAAMIEASGAFIEIEELQRRVGKRIAELTGNEAVFVSCGAAAGIAHVVAACVAGTDPDKRNAFPHLDDLPKNEVILFRTQRNGYDYAVRQTGVKIVEIEPEAEALKAALSDKTAAVFWFAGALSANDPLRLKEAVEIAHARDVPVIVDAAAQIPPISNLSRYTSDDGADAAIFSGGKGLRGPQSTGLVVGKQWIVDGCAFNGSPNSSFGRPMKVGKEELAGCLAAIEWSLQQDEPATLARYEQTVGYWIAGLAEIDGVTAERGFPSEAGQPMPRTIVTFAEDSKFDRDKIVATLWDQNPRIAVAPVDARALALNPQTIEPGEEEIVINALRELLK